MSIVPGEAPPLIDPGNDLVMSGLPASLQAGMIPLPGGQVAVITIRTPDTTLMVTMNNRDSLTEWITILTQLRDSMSATGLITAVNASSVAQARGLQA